MTAPLGGVKRGGGNEYSQHGNNVRRRLFYFSQKRRHSEWNAVE
jgi:hypothetical protein